MYPPQRAFSCLKLRLSARAPDFHVTILETYSTDLREAESASATARRQLEQARAEMRNPASAVASSIAVPELDGRIDTVKRNLDALLQRYTEQHPDVINARRLLKDLEDQRRKELAELQRQAVANPNQSLMTANPALMPLATRDPKDVQLLARLAEGEDIPATIAHDSGLELVEGD